MHEKIDSCYVWQSPWYNLRQDRLRVPDGREYTYTVVEHPGGAWVVPVTAEGQVVLIWHYRHPVGEYCLEVPAGSLSAEVPPDETARRELAEEIGGTAADLRYVGRFYVSNGITNEAAYVYLATGVELGEPHRELSEEIEIRLVPVEEAMRLARSGEMSDGPSALALLWCEELFKQIAAV